MQASSFNIYNASAGSGKTYALVKEYLKILLLSTQRLPFRHILAITFTNKAVAEMKDRIIEALKAFAEIETPKKFQSLIDVLSQETNLTNAQIKEKSSSLLEIIAHNYAAFDVSTIDKFTQKLIRTFAYDLKLPANFEVSLETKDVLNQAVDNLISRAGHDDELTKLLIDFAIEKTDDNKSFNIEYDLNKIASLLINENDYDHVQNLSSKNLTDFESFKIDLKKDVHLLASQIADIASKALEFISECGLEHDDFTRGSLPNFFVKLSQKNFFVSLDNKWQKEIETHQLYPTRVNENTASTLDNIQPELTTFFKDVESLIITLRFKKAILKNLTPLSVLSQINKELQSIKEDENLLLISEFNTIVSEHLKEQPVPFIYERIGEKFKHYFIDEFQDTSVMQWENLKPLICNALSGEHASTMIVGDAKQAIYRWRGGRAEQFIELFNEEKKPCDSSSVSVKSLETNYRSDKSIVEFNNIFFEYLSQRTFSDDSFAELYTKASQEISSVNGGYVNLNFISYTEKEERDEQYCKQVLKTIDSCLNSGANLGEICILVRKNVQGVLLANYLIDNSAYNIVSSESLLLKNNPEVLFTINVCKLILNPENKDIKFDVLSYIANKLTVDDESKFYLTFLDLPLKSLSEFLKDFDINFDFNELLNLTTYEAFERVIYDFKLIQRSNAYLQFLLDNVHDFTNSKSSSLNSYIDYFDLHCDKLSISMSEQESAIQIMTIHKAKGLEFPIVIFPFADLDIYSEKDAKVWFPLNKSGDNAFSETLINYNKDLKTFGQIGEQLYHVHRSELELDNINILYVALTRAAHQLYIISENQKRERLNSYSGLFIGFLKEQNHWNDDVSSYHFGDSKFQSSIELEIPKSPEVQNFISNPLSKLNIEFATNSGYLWDTQQEKAIEKGNLIHLIMSKVKTTVDIDFAINDLVVQGIISPALIAELKKVINAIVFHQDLKRYFSSDVSTFNEKEILLDSGKQLIPDRLVFDSENRVTVIDYKTGKFSTSHEKQIVEYGYAIKNLKYAIDRLILVYIDDEIVLKEVTL